MRKYDIYSRLNYQHNWWDLYHISMSMRLHSQFDMKRYIHVSYKIYNESDYNVNLKWLTISCTNRVFHILGKVDYLGKGYY